MKVIFDFLFEGFCWSMLDTVFLCTLILYYVKIWFLSKCSLVSNSSYIGVGLVGLVASMFVSHFLFP